VPNFSKNEHLAAFPEPDASRRRAEQELRDQREWLRVTLESIGDAVIATDTAGRVTFMNPAAERLTGWPGAEAAGRPLAEVFRIVSEEDLAPVENPVEKVLREGVSAGLANHTLLISRDEHRLPIDDCASPIQDGGGSTLGVVLIFHDVTERREMERELLLRAERLLEADRRKDEFLAMLSHELRNPLAPIRNALHLLATPGVAADQVERARKMMERQVKHMVRLVDDLLDVSRISRDRIQLRRETLDLGEVLDRVEQAARPVFEERGIGFEVQAPPQGLRISADPVRLEQVLANLLQNAAKFTPSGGRVSLTGEREGDLARIAVSDTGAGIEPELLPHLFEAFVQADHSIDRSQGGLGLGLTLAQRLVELHGGSVSADSAGPGQGSEFTVRLPLVEAPGEEGAEESPPAPAELGARA
jgi:PAS domain S-box-containing protein